MKLAVAGTGTPALAVSLADRTFGGRQFAQFHNSVPPYFTSLTCSI